MPSTLLDGRDVIELGDVLLKFLPAGEIYIAGTDDTTRQFLSTPPPSGSGGVKFAVAAVVLAGAIVIGLAMRGQEAPPAPLPQATVVDKVAQTLKDARALLARGDTEGAMQKASTIPEGSNLRESADFKAIQDAWADALFDKALATQDSSEKRGVLDRIARAPAVDPARRKRAADELEAMQRPQVDIADLPSDDLQAEAPSPATSGRPAVPQVAAAPKEPVPAAPKPTAPKPAATPKPQAPAQPKKKENNSLVRSNPFDP
jgi:hypothetical protein